MDLEPVVTCIYDGQKCTLQQIAERNDDMYLNDIYADIKDQWGYYRRVDFYKCSNFQEET